MIKSFRGKMAHDAVKSISLHTNTGSTGYRIVKFETIKDNPGAGSDIEGVLKIFTIPQTAATDTIDLSDNTLLAVNYNKMGNTVVDNDDRTIIVDNVKFNQDIYLTFKDVTGNENNMNYYLELEIVSLSLTENTVATLKDIRNIIRDE